MVIASGSFFGPFVILNVHKNHIFKSINQQNNESLALCSCVHNQQWKLKKYAKCLNLILMNTIRRGNDERTSEYKFKRKINSNRCRFSTYLLVSSCLFKIFVRNIKYNEMWHCVQQHFIFFSFEDFLFSFGVSLYPTTD